MLALGAGATRMSVLTTAYLLPNLLFSLHAGVRPLGTVTAGVLAGLVGIRPTLWIATIGAIGGILWLVPSPIWSLRDVPEAP